METIPQSPTVSPLQSTPDDELPRAKTVFDDPDADIIICSCDSQEFRVLKLYIIKCSPVLSKRIQTISDPLRPAISSSAETRLPVVQLSDYGAILSALLTFIFPVPSVLPPTLDEVMELLSVAQKYEMVSVLADIRGRIALKNPPLICPENAFYAYSLAMKYALRQEAAQAARNTLTFTLSIENLEGKPDVPNGIELHELWKYHQSVQGNLLSNVDSFRGTTAGTLTGLQCVARTQWGPGIPLWLDNYMISIARNPSYFDPVEFQTTLACHVREVTGTHSGNGCASCTRIPHQTMRTFWTALTNFVNENVVKAESSLPIPELESETCSQDHICPPAVQPLPESLYINEADLIVQSSDFVRFRVHKLILASSSQFFKDMFSLPQPSNESDSGLPVLHMSEDAEIVRALITVLYPIPSELPVAYDRVLSLLAASQKYDMPAVQFSIRAEVSYRNLTAQTGEEAFRAYAIASRNRLSPETSTTAHLTLDYSMTIQSLGNELDEFEGWALRNLTTFRKCRRDDILSCFESFLDVPNGPSKIWIGCPTAKASQPWTNEEPVLPEWLSKLLTNQTAELRQTFTNPLIQPSSFRKKYLAALRSHTIYDYRNPSKLCDFCAGVHARQGEEYCIELEGKLKLARDKVFESAVGLGAN